MPVPTPHSDLDPSLHALDAAVTDLDLPVDGRVLADVLAVRSRFEARLVRAVIAWDASGLWGPDGDGARNVTEWVRHHGALTTGEAAGIVSLARLCVVSPTLLAFWEAGRLSSGQVRVVRAAVPRPLLGAWTFGEDQLVPLLEPLDVTETAAVMTAWAARARAELDLDPADRDRDRSCHLSATLDGTAHLSANLTPDAAAVVAAALRKATDPPSGGDDRTPAQRRHDALAHIAAAYLAEADRKVHSQHRPHLNVLVDLHTLTSGIGTATDLGTNRPLTAEDARRIACDANIHTVYRSGSTVLDYGRGTRSIPAPLFTTISIRDGGCRGPACTRPPAETSGHHIHFWDHGGVTAPQNLICLCAYHHWLIHKRGWSVTLAADATATWTNPQGLIQRTRPHPRTDGGPTDQPVAA